MLRLSKGKKIGAIIFSVVILVSIGLMTFYLINGNSFDTRSSAGNSSWAIGDLNGDLKVSMADFNLWLTGYRKFKKDGTYTVISDLNKDKKIGFSDFFLWLDAYREYKHTAGGEFKKISKTNDMGTFDLEYKFMGDNTWFYRMTGTFSKASLCDVGSVNIAIAKNADAVDAVTVYMNGTPFKEELADCTGLFTREGEFTAAENANIALTLRELPKVSTATYKPQAVDYSFMTVTYEYTGSDTWSYTIKGELPNDCFDVTQAISKVNPHLKRVSIGPDSFANMSSPDATVYIYNFISPEKITDSKCSTTVLKYSKTGTFKAGEDSKIKFVSTPAYPAVGLIKAIVPVLTTQATYLGDNLWSYEVKGTFPNGCYSAKTVVHPLTATYKDGFTGCTVVGNLIRCNQVAMTALEKSIYLETVITKEGTSCTGAVVEYDATGKFVAAEKATIGSRISAILK